MIKVVHPLLARGSDALPFRVLLPLDCVLLVFFAVDLGASQRPRPGLNRRLRRSTSCAPGCGFPATS